MMNTWTPSSWQAKPVRQSIDYPNPQALDKAVAQLTQKTPLVDVADVEQLLQELALAAQGQRFILQAGDCAELFTDCNPARIQRQAGLLAAMQQIIEQGLQLPVVPVGRLAGQYAKPRTVLTETREGSTLPSYRGDLINSPEFTAAARQPDPQRLLQGYACAATTLDYLSQAVTNPLYVSHEALHLLYEQALTRQVNGNWYNLSTHYPWIGMRTVSLHHAHIEYIRGISNPIALKIGQDMVPSELAALVAHLNPANRPGKLTLVHRLGIDCITDKLPALLQAVKETGQQVIWLVDPMHGNARLTKNGIKTRDFAAIIAELQQAFRIHRQYAMPLHGVHLELTADEVNECTDDNLGIAEDQLQQGYCSPVDPRLNYQQSIAVAEVIRSTFGV